MRALSIVVADDVPEITDLIAHWLEAWGHSVACVANGVAALKLIRRGGVDLLITDVLMPDGNGLDLITELHDTGSTVRILAISGGGAYIKSTDCVTIAADIGATATLLKPFSQAEFMKGVELALGEPIQELKHEREQGASHPGSDRQT